MNKFYLAAILLSLSSLFMAYAEQTHIKTPATYPDDEAVWHKLPKLKIRDYELHGQSRYIDLLISADPSGRVTDVKIIQSSGLTSLDDKVVYAVHKASFKPTNSPI